MMNIDHVRSRFIKHFDGKTGNIYFSPGRINLIGEHTDYNGPEQLTRALWPRCASTAPKTPLCVMPSI